ncbi:MAG: class I SAM-dependent methyltransferase [Vicinamibacterales bacterium]
MSNDDVYATGFLNRALDPASQPPEIRAFLQAEIDWLLRTVPARASVVDVGCGTGRHLALLADHVRLGVGVDYDHDYLKDACRHGRPGRVCFVRADGARLPLVRPFDIATCLTNTWGTMPDKVGVLDEMRRCAPGTGTRRLTVYSPASVAPRREWYRRLGHTVVDETPEALVTDNGFSSEHFDEARLRAIIGPCTIEPLAGIAHGVTF